MSKHTDQQKIEVTATCRNNEEAKRVAEKYKNTAGVIDHRIVGNVITFVCEVVREAALTVYGKLKDALPWYCVTSCRPVAA